MFQICHLARASELDGVRFFDTWTACSAKVDGMRPGDVWRMTIAGSRVAQIWPACMRVETCIDECSIFVVLCEFDHRSTHAPIPQVATPSFDCYSLREIFTSSFLKHLYFFSYHSCRIWSFNWLFLKINKTMEQMIMASTVTKKNKKTAL